jgi:hypothetical protein
MRLYRFSVAFARQAPAKKRRLEIGPANRLEILVYFNGSPVKYQSLSTELFRRLPPLAAFQGERAGTGI